MKKFRRKIKVVKLAAAEVRECIAVVFLIEPDAEYNLLDCVEAQMLAYRDYECAVSGFLAVHLRGNSEIRTKIFINIGKFPVGFAVVDHAFCVDCIRRSSGSFTAQYDILNFLQLIPGQHGVV